jgi:hypothetical protein
MWGRLKFRGSYIYAIGVYKACPLCLPAAFVRLFVIEFIYLWLYSACEPWPLFQFLNPYTVGRTRWTGDQPVARPLPAHRTTQTQNKRMQTSMPRVGFEPAIPAFKRAKTDHALDRAATAIGKSWN